MANMNDYLLWRGDIPVGGNFKWNAIDSMILARFSYLKLDKIQLEEEETIESIAQKMQSLEEDAFLFEDRDLIMNLGKSPRFQKMLVTDYEKITDKALEKQFGAVTIHLSTQEMYISFLGTDSTITGWKEDVNMGFMEHVPCQVAGKNYLERMAQKYPYKKIRIGGHSKGGNVAIYAAITTTPEIQDRIIKVNNYDGPGFLPKIISQYENEDIMNRIETLIPQESVIGRILTHTEKVTIVASNEKMIYQHDIYSWQVLKDELILLDRNTEMSENISQTFHDWIENSTEEQRRIFFDSLFDMFYSTEAQTFGEMKKTMSTSLPKILGKYNELEQEDKKVMTEMMKMLLTTYVTVSRNKEKEKSDSKKREREEWIQQHLKIKME